MKTSHWWLVRHAPVAANYLYGQMDEPIEHGHVAEYEFLANSLPVPDAVITSDLSRCVDTARLICEQQRTMFAPKSFEGLREQNFGDWQGLSYQQLNDQYPELSSKFWEKPAETTPPNGESFENMFQRTSTCFDALASNFQDDNNLLVAHAGSIRCILGHVLNLNPKSALKIAIAPLSITKLTLFVDETQMAWEVGFVNRVSNPAH